MEDGSNESRSGDSVRISVLSKEFSLGSGSGVRLYGLSSFASRIKDGSHSWCDIPKK